MQGFDPGRVRIALELAGEGAKQRVRATRIDVQRPRLALRLRGMAAERVAGAVSALFAICGQAQAAAAAAAIAAARGEAVAPAIHGPARAEARRELLWRLTLDLPPLLGRAAQPLRLKQGTQALGRQDEDAWQAALGDAWFDELLALLPALEPAAVRVTALPFATAADSLALGARLDAETAACPEWRGKPALTGPAAAGTAAGAWRARLAAARGGFEKVGAGETAPRGLGLLTAAAPAPGVGRATIQTARGLLLHEVVLHDERVESYLIVAPTEWNFHPRGVLVDWLHAFEGLEPDSILRRARYLAATLDACVPSEVVLEPPVHLP